MEQQLHPHVTSWGSLLRMYGNHSSKSLKVKRQEEQQITLLQSKATVNSPNYAILDKLREEMSKLQEVSGGGRAQTAAEGRACTARWWGCLVCRVVHPCTYGLTS